jgi:Helix-turn-helix domain
MTRTSPTVRRRELGQRLRGQHNLTLEDVADELQCSMTKISRLESGKGGSARTVSVTRSDITVSPCRSGLSSLLSFGEPKSKAGGLSMRLVLDPFSGSGKVTVGVQRSARHVVPVLLQTEEYAWEIIDDIEPSMSERVHSSAVAGRSSFDTSFNQMWMPNEGGRPLKTKEIVSPSSLVS